MPNIKSAKKRVIIAEIRRDRNAAAKSTLKTAIKKFEHAVAEGEKENAVAMHKQALSLLDKAGRTNLMHKNAAARQKSRLTIMLNKAM